VGVPINDASCCGNIMAVENISSGAQYAETIYTVHVEIQDFRIIYYILFGNFGAKNCLHLHERYILQATT
jgi:hypothetical protein